jgi:SpoVK/Ycf46/Vps4 family AAA+-type ATPase
VKRSKEKLIIYLKSGEIIGNEIWSIKKKVIHILFSNETVANCTDSTLPKLAEPPVVRERLTTEIEFFVKHIHEQCANDDQIFRRRLSSGHNWSAINYALVTGTGDDERRIRERPVSARDRQGRETPILIIPEPAANIDENKITNHLSPRVISNVDIDTIRSKLQDFTIDDIIQRLRQAIMDDIKTLEHHVTYVHVRICLFLLGNVFLF